MTSKEKQYLKNKLIAINWLSIMSILITFLLIVSCIGFGVSVIQWVSQGMSGTEPSVPPDINSILGLPFSKWFIFALIMSIMELFISSVLKLIAAIIVLATDWKNKQIDDKKLLWGLLAIFLLGFIALLIFSISSMNILKNYNEPENNTDYQHKG